MNFLERNIEDCLTSEANSNGNNIVFECDQLDYYDIPNEEDVSEGLYAAMIMGFQTRKDRFKNQCVDICFKIFSNLAFTKWNNRVADQITYSYVRIRITENSDEERQFRTAMSKLCNKKKFSTYELIGSIFLINLEYRGKGDVFIKNYKCTALNKLWFIDDISDDFHWSSRYTPNED